MSKALKESLLSCCFLRFCFLNLEVPSYNDGFWGMNVDLIEDKRFLANSNCSLTSSKFKIMQPTMQAGRIACDHVLILAARFSLLLFLSND